MTAMKSNETRRPRQRLFWRLLLALFLGMLAWWGIDYVLSPRPAWVLSLENHYVSGRVFGLNDEHEWLFEPASPDKPSVLVDIHSGAIRKLLNNIKPIFDVRKSSLDRRSNLYGRTVWGLNDDIEDEPSHIRLYALDEDAVDKKCIHTWRFSHYDMNEITWGPSGTGLIFVQSFIPHELFVITSIPPSGLFLPLNILLNKEVVEELRLPVLCQVWQLPKVAGDGLQLVSSWRLEPHTRHNNVSFSPDGSLLAIADEGEHSTRGALIYDIKTGRLVKVLETDAALRIAEFRGTYLFCKAANLYPAYWKFNGKELEEIKLSMAAGHPLFDVKAGIRLNLPDSFPNPAGMGVDIEVHPLNPDWVFFYSRPHFKDIGEVMGDWKKEFTFLKRQDNQMEVQAHLKFPKQTSLHWMGQDQLLVFGDLHDSTPLFLTNLAEKNDWVKSIVEKVWPFALVRTIIYDLKGDAQWQWDDAYAVNFQHYPNAGNINLDPTRLILARGCKDNSTYSRLECYTLPLKFYSLWWSRASGLLVVLLAALFFLRRIRSLPEVSNLRE